MDDIKAFDLTTNAFPLFTSQFSVGLPTILPSIQLGLLPSITPIRSPPPTLRSLYDFAMAGPMAGLLVSILFLVGGLGITAALDVTQSTELPGLPLYLLRSSTLSGEFIELFLGKGTLMRELPSDTVLPLHPFAVSGFCGIVANSLALLPLGRK